MQYSVFTKVCGIPVGVHKVIRTDWPDILSVTEDKPESCPVERQSTLPVHTCNNPVCSPIIHGSKTHTCGSITPSCGIFNARQCVLVWCRTKSNTLLYFSVSSTMMDSFQSCHAAAWGFAYHPVGTVWPAGTYRLPLFQTRASQDLWGCVCCSHPLSQSASLSPTGHKRFADATGFTVLSFIWFYHLNRMCVCHWKRTLTLADVPAFLRLPVWTLIR